MNSIKPTYVTFEQTKMLKEKGFNEPCVNYYTPVFTEHGFRTLLRNSELDSFHSAPEQWQVIEWTSLVHNIDIEARPIRYAGDVKTSYYQPYINGCIVNMSKFTTRQEALSEAIDKFLKTI